MSTIEKALAKQKQAAQDKKISIKANTIMDSAQSDHLATPKIKAPNQKNNALASKEVHSTQTEAVEKGTITLNSDRLVERGFIYGSESSHHMQEEFRHIKRKLINNAFGPAAKTLKHSNLIMVTSSNPNEGKTFISINLALSIALEQDKTVLLVDADVLR